MSGKIDKYEYLTGEEILPSYKSRTIKQAKSTCPPLSSGSEKQIKTILKRKEEKQEETLEVLAPKKMRNYNHSHNILRRVDVLPNFPFTASERSAIITYQIIVVTITQYIRVAE